MQWVAAIVERKEQQLAAARVSIRTDAANDAPVENAAEIDPRHIAIDGKTLRRSHDRRKGLGALEPSLVAEAAAAD